MNINCLLFNNFETLDIFGPVEVFGKTNDCCMNFYSIKGGEIINNDNIRIITENINKIEKYDVLMIPGGIGTRNLVNDSDFINKLKIIAEKSLWCLTICTGSILLAKTGLLDNHEATSNKQVMKTETEWIKNNAKNVNWNTEARWVIDKKYYTSSGISAGIDMALQFVNNHFGEEKANEISKRMEYNIDNDQDSKK